MAKKVIITMLFTTLLAANLYSQSLFGYKNEDGSISTTIQIKNDLVLDSVVYYDYSGYKDKRLPNIIFKYDDSKRLTERIGQIIQEHSVPRSPSCYIPVIEMFHYNNQGNIDSVTRKYMDKVLSGNVWVDSGWVFMPTQKIGYDSLNRKVSDIFPQGKENPGIDISYEYDLDGNCTTKTTIGSMSGTTIEEMKYDSLNRITLKNKQNISLSSYYIEYYRDIYEYDSSGSITNTYQRSNIIEQVVEYYNFTQHQYLFDENDRLNKEITYQINVDHTAWNLQSQIDFSYDGDKILEAGGPDVFYSLNGNIDSIRLVTSFPSSPVRNIKFIDNFGNEFEGLVDRSVGYPMYPHFYYSNGTVDYKEEYNKAIDFELSQNYPNPFNPTTMISYQLPMNSFVNLRVYDILGREVATLVNEQKPAGNYEVEFDASNLSSGVYLYKLQAGTYNKTMKMILMK